MHPEHSYTSAQPVRDEAQLYATKLLAPGHQGRKREQLWALSPRALVASPTCERKHWLSFASMLAPVIKGRNGDPGPEPYVAGCEPHLGGSTASSWPQSEPLGASRLYISKVLCIRAKHRVELKLVRPHLS